MKSLSILRSMLGVAMAAGVATVHAANIGFVAPLSGPQALVGQDQLDGFMLAVDQLGGKLGGQLANVIKEDDQLKPEVGQQAVRKLIDRDRVDAIVGLSFSNVLMGKLLVLDEATEGLAPVIREEIWRTLVQLKSHELAQIVIDKNVGRLLGLADRHYVLEKGRVVWEGESGALRSNPDIVSQYLGV